MNNKQSFKFCVADVDDICDISVGKLAVKRRHIQEDTLALSMLYLPTSASIAAYFCAFEGHTHYIRVERRHNGNVYRHSIRTPAAIYMGISEIRNAFLGLLRGIGIDI